MAVTSEAWPSTAAALVALQGRLAAGAASVLRTDPWAPTTPGALLGGCFVAPERGTTGPGRAGDRIWAAAVVWRAPENEPAPRRADRHLRAPAGAPSAPGSARRADDVLAQAVLEARAPAAYRPGLLAARDGAALAEVLTALAVRPDVVLVDATGLDHPRGAGLAVQLGAAVNLPTVGVTRRPLVARAAAPPQRRGASSPLLLEERCVGYWVCTRDATRPLVAHAGWRTTPEVARRVLLESSTPAARTPVPLQEARRVAREARSGAGRLSG